jgi:hypothetical protein
MVRGRVHRADAVEPRRETTGDHSLEETLAVPVIIDTLEEGECLRVGRRCGSQVAAEILDGDVTVTDDVTTLELLRSGVVRGQGIGEGAGDQVRELHLDGEVLVGGDVFAGAGEQHDRRDHVGIGGDVAHDHAVAGSAGGLGSVGQGLARAEVDEVGRVTVSFCQLVFN